MNRRKMIKTLAAGSGVFLIPSFSLLSPLSKPIQLFVVGFSEPGFYEEFARVNPAIHITRIACDLNSVVKVRTKKYNLDIPSMRYDLDKELSYDVLATKLIPGRLYVFVVDFRKGLIEPSKKLINWAKEKRIDFRFLGVSAIIYYSYVENAIADFRNYESDSRINIFDTRLYLNKYRYQTLNKAFDYIEPQLWNKLLRICY